MEILASIASVILLLVITWQVLGSIWNIVSIVRGLFEN